MLKAVILVFIATTFFCSTSASGGGCDQVGAWNDTAFDYLYKSLKAESNEISRYELLGKLIEPVNQGFSSKQSVLIANCFPNELYKTKFFIDHSKRILGMTCDDVLSLLLTMNNELLRLEALPTIVNLTYDLSQNNATILKAWTGVFNVRDAKKIIDSATELSCVWGVIGLKRCRWQQYTRLQYVTKELQKVLTHSLKPDQEFNIISFADSAVAWQKGVVPVNQDNIQSAVQFVTSRKATGGTNMLSAVQTAFGDSKGLAVYLLSDGEPNCCTSDIITAAKKWSNTNQPPRAVNTICFQAGGTFVPAAAQFMSVLANSAGGIYKSII